MKRILVFLSLAFLINTYGQSRKTLNPKTGKITFKQNIKIIDQKAIDATVQIASEKFVNSTIKIAKERIKENGEQMIGEVSFNEGMARGAFNDNFNPNYLKGSTLLYKWEFKDSIITYTLTFNKKYPPIYYNKIERKNKTLTTNIALNHNDPYSHRTKNYEYIVEKSYKVTEYRGQTKIINGYNCFKVIVETLDHEGKPQSANDFMNFTFVMYVTEAIKCEYHPITKFKKVLDKYYPLEIIETNNAVKGYEKVFTLTEIDLK